tara:strand:- start:2903 stop:3187 length:285 start_codon:yes stop_codon:yes gene_type:complete
MEYAYRYTFLKKIKMGKILRIDKSKRFQKVFCFFNFYHPYKYWSGSRNYEDKYAHFRKCMHCNKLQIQTFYQEGHNMLENDWKELNINDVNEPK